MPEIPSFELPTLEAETVPRESGYIHVEIPDFEIELPEQEPAEIATEEVIDLDAIDAQFEQT